MNHKCDFRVGMKIIYNKGKVFIFILMTGFSFAACHTLSTSNKKTFRYNEPTGIASLDPAFAKNQSIIWPVHQIIQHPRTNRPAFKYCAFTRKILGYLR